MWDSTEACARFGMSVSTPSSSIVSLARLLARSAAREWLIEQNDSWADSQTRSTEQENRPTRNDTRKPCAEGLNDPVIKDEAAEVLRSLINRIELEPREDGAGLDARLHGDLARIVPAQIGAFCLTENEMVTDGILSNYLTTELLVEQVCPTDLELDPRNARTHSKKQVRQIAASIREFGFVT